MQNAVLHSIGVSVPDRIVPNSYFDELLGEPVSEWLQENVHIFERRWLEENQSVSDLAVDAARKALKHGNLSPEDIDLLIISTDTPEYISPSTASKVQYLTGMINAGTFDINTACAGFVTAMDTAVKYIRSDEHYQHIMVIGAYAMSKYLNMQDKKTVTLFADAAGAVILKAEKNSDRGYLGSQLITQGQYFDYMGIYAGGSFCPTTAQVVQDKGNLLQFVKKFPKELNPQMWSMMAHTLSDRIGVKSQNVDHYFMTQININSIWETMDLLNVPREKAPTIMHNYGYTGSACIPLALNDSWMKGKLRPGDLLYFIGSGGGLAFASAGFRF
jgi:3-oxoacyl-[acyl-carrier-protein] synthase III